MQDICRERTVHVPHDIAQGTEKHVVAGRGLLIGAISSARGSMDEMGIYLSSFRPVAANRSPAVGPARTKRSRCRVANLVSCRQPDRIGASPGRRLTRGAPPRTPTGQG